jgi:hypothetical protein
MATFSASTYLDDHPQNGVLPKNAYAFRDALCWSCEYFIIWVVWIEDVRNRSLTVEQRQTKRYRLRTSVKFSWESAQGGTRQGEGCTRDISSSGVFVVTNDRLPLGTTVKLDVALPAPRRETPGASLRTSGHVVRSESLGFAAVAEAGFRMQFPSQKSSRHGSRDIEGGASTRETSTEKSVDREIDAISRYWM